MLARLEIRKRMIAANLKSILIGTVHDSVVADCPDDEYMTVARIMYDSVIAVPKLCKQVFGVEFNLPTVSECQYGKNKLEMIDITF